MHFAADRGQRLLTWTIPACALALFAPLAWPLVTGRVFTFDDLGHYHVPLRYLYQQALQGGDSLLWTPSLFSGFYLHGEGQIGLLHPWHLLLYALLPLQVAFNLEFLSSYAVAFAGMSWLLRRLGLTAIASRLGGMLFAFSGFLLLHHPHVNAVAVTAHLPWMLACLDLVVTGVRPKDRAAGYAGTALVLASALLLGFPQAVWWIMLAAMPFAVLRAYQAGHPARLIGVSLAVATGVLMGAVQLLPTLDAAAASVRPTLTRAFFLSYSLHPWNIVQLWSPYAFGFAGRGYQGTDFLHVHEFGVYSGTLLMLAPIWLWIRRGALTSHRTLIVATAVFAVVMFVLALGQYGYVGILLTYLPGVGSLRAPARYIVLVQFALAILAAIAIEDLVTLAQPDREAPIAKLRSRDGALLGSVALLSVLTTLLLNTHILPVRADLPVGPLGEAAIGSAMVVAVTIAMLTAARGVRWGVPLLIVLSAADIGCWGLEYVYREPPATIESLSRGLPKVTQARIVVGSEGLWMDRPVLKGYRITGGYVGLYPNVPYTSYDFAQRAGAGWILDEGGGLMNAPWRAAPRASLMTDPRAAVAAGDADVARVLDDRPGRLVVKTSAPGPRLLVTTERFHEGWLAAADGRPLERVEVHGFVAARVEAGEHKVVFTFRPRSFVRGRLVSAAGGLLLLLGTAAMLKAGKQT